MAASVASPGQAPDWDALYETADAQAGHFTTAQAAAAGYSSPLLHKHRIAGRIRRVRRGVYRLIHYPPTDHEELVVLWLWAERSGVFSHQTALALHDLSDLLPSKLHLTLPEAWKQRRLRVPDGAVIHYATVDGRDRDWVGVVPVTSARRTIEDCIEAAVSPELIEQAIGQASDRGLIPHAEKTELSTRLAASQRGDA